MALQHRQIELQLGREVLVENGFTDACPVGDLVHARRVVAAVDEDLAGGDEQLPASFVAGQSVATPVARGRAARRAVTGRRLRASPLGGVGEIAHQSSIWIRTACRAGSDETSANDRIDITTPPRASASSAGRGPRGGAPDPQGGALCHPGSVTYDPGRRGGGRVPVLRNEWREPLRAQRDPVADDSGRTRSNRDDRQQWRKQTWLGRFVSTYGWRAYALPVLIVLTAVVVYQTVTGTGAPPTGGRRRTDSGAADHRPGEHRHHRCAAEGHDPVRRQSADRHPARRRALHRGGRQDVAHRARHDSEGG